MIEWFTSQRSTQDERSISWSTKEPTLPWRWVIHLPEYMQSLYNTVMQLIMSTKMAQSTYLIKSHHQEWGQCWSSWTIPHCSPAHVCWYGSSSNASSCLWKQSRLFTAYNLFGLSSSSLWREAFSRSLPPLRSFARTVGPPLAAGPRSLLHPCRGRSGGSRWSTVGHRHVSTPVKAAHHPSTWCRFVGSGLLVHRAEVWRRVWLMMLLKFDKIKKLYNIKTKIITRELKLKLLIFVKLKLYKNKNYYLRII